MATLPFPARPSAATAPDPPVAVGLTSAGAAARLLRYGPNLPAPPPRLEALRELARYLANPLVLILLLASVMSAAFGQLLNSALVALMSSARASPGCGVARAILSGLRQPSGRVARQKPHVHREVVAWHGGRNRA